MACLFLLPLLSSEELNYSLKLNNFYSHMCLPNRHKAVGMEEGAEFGGWIGLGPDSPACRCSPSEPASFTRKLGIMESTVC